MSKTAFSIDDIMGTEMDYLFKVAVCGDSGVGKTSLVNRFSEDVYDSTFISTIGVDFKIKTMDVTTEEGKPFKVKLQMVSEALFV